MRAFVIAMDCEADCVRPWLGLDDRLYVSGIGKVNAAAATQRAICEGADEIWNVGLCGGFGDDIEVGGCSSHGQAERGVEYRGGNDGGVDAGVGQSYCRGFSIVGNDGGAEGLGGGRR